MGVEFEEVTDQARWKKSVENIAEILELAPEDVKNYLVLVYDGTPELKADTDIPNVVDVVAVVTLFLEHVTGQKVRLVEG